MQESAHSEINCFKNSCILIRITLSFTPQIIHLRIPQKIYNSKNCSFIKKKCPTGEIYNIEFCFECDKFPCPLLLEVSKKGKERFKYDFVENLNLIKKNGVEWFVEQQTKIHKCEKCGDTICIHNKECYTCNRENILTK